MSMLGFLTNQISTAISDFHHLRKKKESELNNPQWLNHYVTVIEQSRYTKLILWMAKKKKELEVIHKCYRWSFIFNLNPLSARSKIIFTNLLCIKSVE